jgi:hypothetical protein
MGIIFYGSKQIPIGYEEIFVKCPCCETHNWADIMVISKYFHIYWLPMFPFDKAANLICKKCGLKRYELSFDDRLISNFEEIKGKFRHPWFTYSGIGLFSFIVLAIIAASAV